MRCSRHAPSILQLAGVMLLSPLGAACTGEELRDHARLSRLERTLDDVIHAGAYVCAPHELALARANTEFARIELVQGNPGRASEHMLEAEQNAGAARLLSPKERCQNTAQPVPDLSNDAPEDSDRDGIPDAADRCPSEAEDRDGTLDADGCRDWDDDEDGLDDDSDRCPKQPEDWDGFQDEDGCPDPDNDADGVTDDRDDCPTQPGTSELAGCTRTEYPGITIFEKELRLTTPVEFEARTATIRSVSIAALDSLVSVLQERVHISLEIAVHTDSQGDPESNLQITQAQANAVASYLIEHGVSAPRLTARGYGDTRPIESNSTSRGRAINRRLELIRSDRAP
jgi:outer membrane protein OmpA-like peptidoglycan-associated protein